MEAILLETIKVLASILILGGIVQGFVWVVQGKEPQRQSRPRNTSKTEGDNHER